MRWEYLAGRETPRLARHAASDYAEGLGAGEDVLARLSLCVGEAVTNAVVHAYREQPGRVVVEAAYEDHWLEVVVRDEAGALMPPPDGPGLGLGLPLTTKMPDASA